MVFFNIISDHIRFWLTGYNEVKYWKRRNFVIGTQNCNFLWRYYCLFYCKRTEFRQNASLGTDTKGASVFVSPPVLPHRLSGIFVACGSKIGRNCTILQHVTIGKSKGLVPVIGDNVMIGAGATIIGGITIGDNCIIGANVTITKDVPPNTTVVSQPPRYLNNKDTSLEHRF